MLAFSFLAMVCGLFPLSVSSLESGDTCWWVGHRQENKVFWPKTLIWALILVFPLQITRVPLTFLAKDALRVFVNKILKIISSLLIWLLKCFMDSYWYNCDSNYWSAVYKHTYGEDFKLKAGYDSEVRLGWASLWVCVSFCNFFFPITNFINAICEYSFRFCISNCGYTLLTICWLWAHIFQITTDVTIRDMLHLNWDFTVLDITRYCFLPAYKGFFEP